jgi:hypothetical protein
MKTHFLIAAGLLTAFSGLQAQMERTPGAAFQYFTAADSGANFKFIGIEPLDGPVVTGRPFSATEERHTLQILGDGTRIENTETHRFYRDDQGRTRTERPDGVVMIHDPVKGITAEMDVNNKKVQGMTVMRRSTPFNSGLEATKAKLADEAKLRGQIKADISAQAAKSSMTGSEEKLGLQSVNGVMAEGFRKTTNIDAGQIGNDRPIRIVSERWFSSDLQVLVKSSNSDPRFGETNYQLTNISQAAPDSALFQVPDGPIGHQ